MRLNRASLGFYVSISINLGYNPMQEVAPRVEPMTPFSSKPEFESTWS